MVEPVSAALAGGAIGAYVAKRTADSLGRLLGPAADEAARALQRFTETRLRNVGRVVEAAERKTAAGHTRGGAVPLRVALRILDEGGRADDDFLVEYLGGVLASSRTPQGRDDRGNTYAALVSQLSTYHLRSHYIFYTEMHRVLHGQSFELGDLGEVAAKGEVFVPRTTYHAAMEFGTDEDPGILASTSLWWLDREQLLNWPISGSLEYLSNSACYSRYMFPEGGTVARPTIPGVELYLWALGKGQLHPNAFLTMEVVENNIAGIDIPQRSCRLVDLAKP